MNSPSAPRLLGRCLAAGASLLLAVSPARAAMLALDNGGNSTYTGGWANGSNGGTGFGAWTLNPASSTNAFIGNASTNGNGSSGSVGSTSFGLFSNGSTANAIRPFTGSLSIGQTFSVNFDNGYVSNGGPVVGFQLLTASDLNTNPQAPRFQFLFFGGSNNYSVYDGNAGSPEPTTHGFTADGMSTSFTLTGTNTYSFTVKFNDNGTSQTFSGNLGGTTGATIDGVRFFNYIAGSDASSNVFFNNLAIVPEPATPAWVGLAVVGLTIWRLRRRAA